MTLPGFSRRSFWGTSAMAEEGWFENGRWVPSRQLAGDETGQGQNLSLRSHPADRNPDRFAGIQRFTLYRYGKVGL